MEEKPTKGNCNDCGRECTHANDFDWIKFGNKKYGDGIWYCQCRYCRARNTKRFKKMQ